VVNELIVAVMRKQVGGNDECQPILATVNLHPMVVPGENA
jgi:hypothetical protein